MLSELDAGNRLSLTIFVFSVPLFWARLAGTSGLDQRADRSMLQRNKRQSKSKIILKVRERQSCLLDPGRSFRDAGHLFE
jgi:hypothetical protein